MQIIKNEGLQIQKIKELPPITFKVIGGWFDEYRIVFLN